MMASSKAKAVWKINQTKCEDIKYLYEYFVKCNNAKKKKNSNAALYRKVATILHVSALTVARCVKNEIFEKVAKSNKYKSKKIDDFSQDVIRRKIYKLYERRELPTIQLIQNEIKDDICVSNSLLRITLL